MALSFGVSVFSTPVSASTEEVCVRASSGDVVCGTPVAKPSSSSKKPDTDETTQTEVSGSLTLELKSCARKQNTVSCTLSISSSQDKGLGFWLRYTKMVDREGTEYHPNKFQVGKSIAGENGRIQMDLVKNIKYKTIIVFEEVPISTPQLSLLEISLESDGGVKFRNIPIINPDGSFTLIPDDNPPVRPPSSNNSGSKPKVCLPVVGCL
ncbi:hypothetical protein FACHB389_33550 [Nostoc calcicola FACHB-389]|nr:hypothetical protein FACHB389_33550 [Nostoc calcicola FACHB-389]